MNSLCPYGYNIELGGNVNSLSEESKAKISRSLMGNIPWNKGKLTTVKPNKDGKLNGFIQAKDPVTGEVIRIHKSDPRWISKELVGIRSSEPCHENTRAAAIRTHKGVSKTAEHKQKISDTFKKLKWYCNFGLDKVGRFQDGLQPSGFIRVSGPHKRKVI